MPQSSQKLAVKGAAWTIIGYGSSQILRFSSNLILTRLLIPEYFGLMAIVNTFRMGLKLFSDIGISQNIVQSKHGDDPVFLNTAWTINAIRGVGLWILCLLFSWPLSKFYGEPLLFPVLSAMSVTVLMSGLISTRLFTLNRHMKLGKITMLELLSQAIGIITMVVIAYIHPSIWALVCGGIISESVKTIASYIIIPGHKHKFILDAKSRKEIVSFGRWIFLSSIIMFVAEQSDRIILGKLVPLDILGIYSIAYIFSNLPSQIMKQMSFKVIFPLVAKKNDIPRDQLKKKLGQQRWKLHAILIPLFVVLACFGDSIIQVLYDSRYQQAAWMMPILIMGTWFSVLFFIANACLLALGKSIYVAQSRSLRFIVISVGLIIGYKIQGILGAIIVIAMGDIPSYIAIQYGLYREKIDCLWQDIFSTMVLVSICTCVILIRQLAGLGTPLDLLL